jgi:hypothetical protein
VKQVHANPNLFQRHGSQEGITFLLLIAVLAGCGTLPVLPVRTAPPHPLPAGLADYYRYTPQPLEASVESTQDRSGFRIQRFRLLSPGEPGSRAIEVDWYRPAKKGRLPLILMSPILAGDDLYVREFARFYAARGLHAVIVYRPEEVFSADRNLQDLETHFHESVIQLRQAIDWLQTQEAIDSERIGSFAISMGAILTTILAAVEPRVKAHVFGLAAGHIPEIIMTSQDKAIRKRRKAVLERNDWTQAQGLQHLKEVIVSEPMTFAPAIEPDRSLMIVGIFDRVLRVGRSLDLWRAMGRPRLIVLPTGHYTAVLATPYLKIVTYSFLKRQLR